METKSTGAVKPLMDTAMNKLSKGIMNLALHTETVTAQSAADALSGDKRVIAGAIANLVKSGYLVRVGGKKGAYIYAAIKSPALTAALTRPDTPVRQREPSVIEQCRRNWQGYSIHKIFGSARATA